MPQLTFLHSWAVWLSVGATAPLIIHLLSRRRPLVVPLPTVRFIRRGRRRSYVRTQFRHLLLLLLRMALIVLAALVVARPFLGGTEGGERNPSVAPATVLILDDSLSMNYTVGDASWFDAARSRALEVVQQLHRQSVAAVLTTSQPTGKITADLDLVLNRVRTARPTARAGSCWRALRGAADLLKAAAGARREVFLFTDMTRGAWAGAPASPVDMGPDTCVWVLDCGEVGPGNLAVVELRHQGEALLQGATLRLAARVIASQGSVERKVQLELDGRPVARCDVALRAGEEQELGFAVRLVEGGHHWGRVTALTPDPLAADDERSFVLDVPPAVTVLCVEDRTVAGQESESYFFRLALNPWQDPAEGVFRVARARSEDLTTVALAPYDVVALVGSWRVRGDAWERLAAYVAGGGGLLAFSGPASADAYRTDAAVSLLGVSVEESLAAVEGDPFRLRVVRTDHPVAEALEASGANLAEPLFWSCRRLVLRQAMEVMSFGEALPALVLSGPGGRVAVFASTADDGWGLFARTAAYVPFCREVVLHLAGHLRGGLSSYTVGAHVPVEFEVSRWPTTVHVTAPGAQAPERLMAGATPGRQTYWKTDVPGYYGVRFERQDRQWAGGFAVNAPAGESYLDKVALEDVTNWIRAAKVQPIEEPRSTTAPSTAAAGATELTPYVIGLALCVMVLESLLANRFYGAAGG